MWSDAAQRGRGNLETSTQTGLNNDAGLVDQSLSGGDLKSEIQDAQQGVDADTRRDVQEDGAGLNPYGNSSVESTQQAAAMLAPR